MRRILIVVGAVALTVAAAALASVVLSEDGNTYRTPNGPVGPASRYPIDGHMHGEHGV